MPFNTTKTIPTRWSAHHADAAAGGMNAKVQIFNPADDTTGWDEATESKTQVHGAPVYDDLARIQETDSPLQTVQAAQEVTSHRYLVQLVMDAPHIEQGWLIQVTECINDTDLVAWTVDRPLQITDVQHGSERFTRDLQAIINLD